MAENLSAAGKTSSLQTSPLVAGFVFEVQRPGLPHDGHYDRAFVMSAFENRYGIARPSITLANWRERPASCWSFTHVSELVPSAVIHAGGGRRDGKDNHAPPPLPLPDVLVEVAGKLTSLEDFLTHSMSDRFVLWRDGHLKIDWTAAHSDAALPHLLFSISKSLTGLLAGILQDEGILDPAKPVSHYLPQTADGGYGDCPLQHLLDMRTSIEFLEEYLDRDGDYARYRRAMLWNPPEPDLEPEPLSSLLFRLKKGEGAHGGPFCYLSPNSDLLALLVEHAAGAPYAELMSQLVWQKAGARSDAFITVDAKGAPRGAGGISATAHDLLRVGRLFLEEGSIGGRQIVSPAWIADTTENGDQAAWDTGNFADFLPGARYRNQWYCLARPSQVVLAIGIHGQFLYIDRRTKTIMVKFASHALPQNDQCDISNLEFLKAVAALDW